jgi:hypothetical protein
VELAVVALGDGNVLAAFEREECGNGWFDQ